MSFAKNMESSFQLPAFGAGKPWIVIDDVT
jgi:hypothetical protein